MNNRDISAGYEAERHLEYLAPLFDQLAQELIIQWANTKPMETVRREQLWREVNTIEKTRLKLIEVIETGSLAREQAKRKHG